MRQVGLKIRSPLQGFVSHPLLHLFTLGHHFDTFFLCLPSQAVGNSLLASSHFSVFSCFFLFSQVQVLCMEMCSPVSAGLQSCPSELTFFFFFHSLSLLSCLNWKAEEPSEFPPCYSHLRLINAHPLFCLCAVVCPSLFDSSDCSS